MVLETFALLRCLRDGEFDSSVVITFNADLTFYEQVVLATLRSRGCYNNFVLMDLRQYEDALRSAAGLLSGLGRLYGLWPVAAPSAFHPKIILLCGERCGRVILGSGNLTVRGMSSNWEVFSETNHTPKAENENLLRQVWAFIRSITANVGLSVARQLSQVEQTSPWLLGDVNPSGWPRFLVARPGGPSLAEQVEHVLTGRVVRRLVVVAPFFDRVLGGLDALRKALSPEKVSLVVQPKKVSLPGNALSRMLVDAYRFTPEGGSRSPDAYLHAKLYLMETDEGEYCLWGSPNCSVAALAPPADKGNFEVGLLAKGLKGHFRGRLGLGSSLAKGSRIHDPKLLYLHEATAPKQSGRLQLTNVEFADGQLEATVASGWKAPKEQTGRIRLTAGFRALADVLVKQSTEGTYRGKWNPGAPAETVIARLVLGSGANAVASTPAAVHFQALLARAIPSRRTANVRKLLEDIQAGTEAWADGLEKVCELIFQLETLKADEAVKAAKAKLRDEGVSAGVGKGKEVGYEYFLAEPSLRGGTGPASGSESSFLVELVQMLGTRLLAGVETSEQMEDVVADADSWRYREEAEKDTAEAGNVVPPNRMEGPDVKVGLYKRLREGYLRLMKAVARRAEVVRDEKQVAGRDELLRLHIVATLVLQGT